jgi:hypothetical protein
MAVEIAMTTTRAGHSGVNESTQRPTIGPGERLQRTRIAAGLQLL